MDITEYQQHYCRSNSQLIRHHYILELLLGCFKSWTQHVSEGFSAQVRSLEAENQHMHPEYLTLD